MKVGGKMGGGRLEQETSKRGKNWVVNSIWEVKGAEIPEVGVHS